MHPLEHIKSFAKMTPEVEAQLLSMMEQFDYRKGDVIKGAVNLLKFGYYIISGAARVFYTRGGKEFTIAFTFDDEYIVFPRRYLNEHPDTICVQFLENTSVICVPQFKVKDLVECSMNIDYAVGMLFLNSALLRYNETLEERLSVMQTCGARERYEWLTKRYPRILERATVTQIASFLGLTKETLYRIRHNNY